LIRKRAKKRAFREKVREEFFYASMNCSCFRNCSKKKHLRKKGFPGTAIRPGAIRLKKKESEAFFFVEAGYI
jgi:hypothetical protein